MSAEDTALLTEHFGYPPVSLLDDIINAVNLLAEKSLTVLESTLNNTDPKGLGFGRPLRRPPQPPKRKASRNQPPPPPPPPDAPVPTTPKEIKAAAEHEIENGTHQLETLLCASIDRNFDLLELYSMRNILCVKPEDRDWIRLSHYDGLDLDPGLETDPDLDPDSQSSANGRGHSNANADKPSVESVSALRRKVQASQKINAALHAEHARNEALLTQLRAILGIALSQNLTAAALVKTEEAALAMASSDLADASPAPPAPLQFLRSKSALASIDARAPIATTTEFTLSQLASLRALSASLRGMAPDIKAGLRREDLLSMDEVGKEEDDDEGSWRTQRARYVEGATRRHLENARGLELGRQGEVRDGEWQGGGRVVARDEIEGLEAVVAAFLSAGAESQYLSTAAVEETRQDDADQMDES